MNCNEFLAFATGQATDVGCNREINEDSFLTRPDYGVWVVADGMGGHAAGDFASQTIVRQLNSVGMPASAEDLRARFMERLARANDAILEHAAELNRGAIGATLVGLLVYGQDYACIWAGDSRIYLLRHGQIVQQTQDHTEVRALLEAGTITAEEAAAWPRKNVITRAIGVTAEPECDIVAGRLQPGDIFVLCSDGLTEHLTDTDIADFTRNLPPQRACDEMIRETLARGAKDNVTVIVMQCHPLPTHMNDSEDTDEITVQLDEGTDVV
jgi:protein phosphatase